MPQNALNNPLVLPILGLLIERPRHQYDILRELRARYPFLQAKTATVYTLVHSLVERGLLTWDDAAAEGTHRSHACLTSAGLTALRDRVERHLQEADPNVDPKFAIALAYLGVLPPKRASTLLHARAEQLRSDREGLEESLNRPELQELHMIEAHFLSSRLEHDCAWLTRLATRIETGQLNWP